MENEDYTLVMPKQGVVQKYDFSVHDKSIAPEFKPYGNRRYIPYGYKGKNDYPDQLIYLYESSAIHSAIVNSKTTQVTGNGFVPRNGQFSEEQQAFLDAINKRESSRSWLKKIVTDKEIFGGWATFVIWSKDWSRIAELVHVDFSKIRIKGGTVPYEEPSAYIYRNYWDSALVGRHSTAEIEIPAFDIRTARENNRLYRQALANSDRELLAEVTGDQSRYTQLFYWKPYTPGKFYYPIPKYAGAIRSIGTEIQADIYADNSLRKGLTADAIVTFFGITDEKVMKNKAEKFMAQHTGASSSGSIVINFANDQDSKIDIQKIEASNADKRYTVINENVLQKILTGHGVTSPLLYSIKTAGQLGGGAEVLAAHELFYSTVIQASQIEVEDVFNMFMEVNNFEPVQIEKLNIAFIYDDKVTSHLQDEETDTDNDPTLDSTPVSVAETSQTQE